jgi:hypothetical protein
VSLGSAYRLGARWIPLDGPAPLESLPGDEVALVARESAATLVDVLPASVVGPNVAAAVTLPSTVGRYRLEVTVHDGDGVALPYAVQASIPGVVVYVGGPGAAWLDAPGAVSVTAGTLTSVQVLVANGEPRAWGSCTHERRRFDLDEDATCPGVRLVGRWIGVDSGGSAPVMTRALAVRAASAQATWLSGPVPSEPGLYILVVSIERETGDGVPQVLGRPTTVTVMVAGVPLVPGLVGS